MNSGVKVLNSNKIELSWMSKCKIYQTNNSLITHYLKKMKSSSWKRLDLGIQWHRSLKMMIKKKSIILNRCILLLKNVSFPWLPIDSEFNLDLDGMELIGVTILKANFLQLRIRKLIKKIKLIKRLFWIYEFNY